MGLGSSGRWHGDVTPRRRQPRASPLLEQCRTNSPGRVPLPTLLPATLPAARPCLAWVLRCPSQSVIFTVCVESARTAWIAAGLAASRSRERVFVALGPHRIPESQHGRGWKGPLWVTQPNPLPKQGHPVQAAQDLVQVGLEYLQKRRLHRFPGQPVRPWPRLPREAVAAPSLAVFKARRDGALSTLGWWWVSLPTAGGWNWVIHQAPSNPHRPTLPWFAFR